jgi:hypothetical protein
MKIPKGKEKELNEFGRYPEMMKGMGQLKDRRSRKERDRRKDYQVGFEENQK